MMEWHIKATKYSDKVEPIGVVDLETSTDTGINSTYSGRLYS